jgi:hypothetical protein
MKGDNMKTDLETLALIITSAYTVAKKDKEELISHAEIDIFIDNLIRIIYRLNQLKEQGKYSDIFQ